MKIPDSVYNWLKWFCLTALPAVIVFLNTCLPLWGVEGNMVTNIVTTIAAVAELIGALIAVSTVKYYTNVEG